MQHPYFEEHRASGKYVYMEPYENLDQGPKFTAGLIKIDGGIMPTPPVLMSTIDQLEKHGVSELISVYHLGDSLSGHGGIVHGGLLATLLDEALCRCGFALLPHHVGVTANLNIDYKAPTPTNSYIALEAHTTEVDGRKVWIEGEVFVLPPPEEYDPTVELKPTMKAKMLVVEPLWYEKLIGSPASLLHEQVKALSEKLKTESSAVPDKAVEEVAAAASG